jgi:DNA-directed RNA polymerase sigma subunit (sigma70/sigma32)
MYWQGEDLKKHSQPLRGQGEMTFTEIGARLGISKVRARQLYLKGIEKLRRKAGYVRNWDQKLQSIDRSARE